jgi:large subunit ribosomal protein L24
MTATKLKVKKGDKVIVITGRDKGKTGEIVKVMPTEQRVVVAGVNQVKKHRKASQMNAGGIDTIDLSIHVSNVAFFDAKTNKPTRVGSQTLKDGTKVRVAKRSGEVLDK